MMKQYDIFLGQEKIGTTRLEKEDAAMGVVFGVIQFQPLELDYDFFKAYCLSHQIPFTDISELRLINTSDIPSLQVLNPEGIAIPAQARYIEGMDGEGFEVFLLGIAYPFYGEEFPHHQQAYEERFQGPKA